MYVLDVYSAPAGRSGHCMTSISKYLIIYGGYDYFSNTIYNELWIYNTVSSTWRLYPVQIETASRCISSAICAAGNFVYIFGGTSSSLLGKETNSLISFDIINATWQIISPHTDEYHQNSPPPMYGSCIFYHNKSLYIFGGCTALQFFDTMYQYCLTTSTWAVVVQNGLKQTPSYRTFGTVFKNK
ncbi:Nitrile-specifier protein 5 [Thelohanellus kitauei]|uniref:Nitrile-specifier protein 5 n=1 Tax=Thelohanellus kitauei TaxID=669202 RepID=A0A0C2MZL9_THEKT|nr:Nitrile-specifier protein 5 [Thelohanellus kitauei]